MRYQRIDNIRGLTLISMIGYHLVWDLVWLFGRDWGWFASDLAYVWQQSICWSFIFLSGFSWSLGKKHIRRGLEVFFCGLAVSFVTLLVMPQERVLFGILTFLGTSMLVLAVLDRYLQKVREEWGFFFCVLSFALTKQVNRGYLGFGRMRFVRLPEGWYRNLGTAYLGFPGNDFYSTDYFSIFPWIFLFLAGYFGYRILEKAGKMKILKGRNIPVAGMFGRHSLILYMLHQPMIYFLLSLIMSEKY